MNDYKRQLWDEIARIRDMHVNFNSRLWTFKWVREPRIVLCKYERKAA